MKVDATLIYGAIGIALTAAERFSPQAQLSPPAWRKVKAAMERGEHIEIEGHEKLAQLLKEHGPV